MRQSIEQDSVGTDDYSYVLQHGIPCDLVGPSIDVVVAAQDSELVGRQMATYRCCVLLTEGDWVWSVYLTFSSPSMVQLACGCKEPSNLLNGSQVL